MPRHLPGPGARPGRHTRVSSSADASERLHDAAADGPSLALPVLDADLEARLRARMAEVEERARRGTISSEAPFVTEAARHLHATPAASGSGRCWCCSPPRPATRRARRACVTAACVVELTHLGVALPRRRDGRGRPAPRRRVGQRPLGQPRRDPDRRLPVLQVLGADRRPRRRTPYASRPQTFTRLVEGQILETLGPADGEDPLEHYLRVVAGKTGSLIATSARYGARFAGAPPEVEEALTAYGEKVGVAFQLSDDILDIASESDESGKTPGTDLREGVPTLPVLIAQRSDRPGRRAAARAARPADLTDDALHAEALALLREHPAMDEARAYVARPRRARPRSLLKVLPEGPVRDALDAFAGAHRHPHRLTFDRRRRSSDPTRHSHAGVSSPAARRPAPTPLPAVVVRDREGSLAVASRRTPGCARLATAVVGWTGLLHGARSATLTEVGRGALLARAWTRWSAALARSDVIGAAAAVYVAVTLFG